MKVLQLISSGGMYGAETMLLNFISLLERTDCQNVLGVFHNSHRLHTELSDRAKSAGLKVKVFRCNGRVDWNIVRSVRNYIQSEKIDVVHSHGYKSDIYGYAAARQFNIPLIATHHSDHAEQRGALRLYQIADHLILRLFHKVVAVSDTTAQSLEAAGVPKHKIETITNGIDFVSFQGQEPTLTKELGQPGKKIVGLVGRLIAEKGGADFLYAARDVLTSFPNTLFVFIGEGPYRQKLEELARTLGLEGSVIFCGTRSDMPGVYASLDMVVLPSFNEGMPMTVLEGLAANRPVIASRVGGIPQVITHEQTGILTEPRDVVGLRIAMARILADPALGERLGSNGHALVMEHFSAKVMTQRYLALYRRMTEAGATKA